MSSIHSFQESSFNCDKRRNNINNGSVCKTLFTKCFKKKNLITVSSNLFFYFIYNQFVFIIRLLLGLDDGFILTLLAKRLKGCLLSEVKMEAF